MVVARKSFVLVSTLMILIALVLETGARLWLGEAAVQGAGLAESGRPGWGLPALGVLDALLLLMLVFMTLVAFGASAAVTGRVQGAVMAVVSALGCLGALAMLMVVVALLMLMVSLLLAVPFGTAVYFAAFGHFDRSTAAATLGVVMLLKLGAALFLVLHTMQALKSKTIVALFACSILLTLLVAFLHGLPPRPLVSITDAIAAIVAVIVGIVWAVYYVGGGLVSLWRVIKDLLRRRRGGEVTAR